MLLVIDPPPTRVPVFGGVSRQGHCAAEKNKNALSLTFAKKEEGVCLWVERMVPYLDGCLSFACWRLVFVMDVLVVEVGICSLRALLRQQEDLMARLSRWDRMLKVSAPLCV